MLLSYRQYSRKTAEREAVLDSRIGSRSVRCVLRGDVLNRRERKELKEEGQTAGFQILCVLCVLRGDKAFFP